MCISIVKTRKRTDEFDRIIQKLYEHNVSGHITDERYDKMAQSYESEQATLSKKLVELEETEASYGEERNSIDDFIANAKRFIDIQELTPEIVHAFVFKICVYEKKEKWSHTEGNDIDIVFTVGFREQYTVRTPTETEIPRRINASVLPLPVSPLRMQVECRLFF